MSLCVRVVDAQGRLRIEGSGRVELLELAWQWSGQGWIEDGLRVEQTEIYYPDGVLEWRNQLLPSTRVPDDAAEEERDLRGRHYALQCDAPSERCEITLSIDGFLDVEGVLPPSSPQDRPTETFEATLVRRP